VTATDGDGLFDVDTEATYKTPDGSRRVGWVMPDEPTDRRRGSGPSKATGPKDVTRPPRWWEQQAEQIIRDLAQAGTFTSDDLRQRLPAQVSPSNNEVGALFRRLAAAGRIHCVGYEQTRRPEGHGRLIRRWAA
jgi:hypothetical protein